MATAPKKSRTATPKDETKAQKFSRLASMRVTAAIKKISLIGNLAGPGYEYTPAQLANIRTHLGKATEEALVKFDKTAAKAASSIQI